jgi:integrase
MASIRKTKANTYKVTVYTGRDENGVQQFEYGTFDGLSEAKAFAREIENDVENGTYSKLNKIKFSAYADDWLELIESEVKPSTYVSYKMYVNTHFKPEFGKLKLGVITDFHIRKYMAKKQKKLTANTIRKHFFVLNRMLGEALKTKNPCIGIKLPKLNNYEPHILQESEFELLHSAIKGLPDELPVLLAAWCGMREGEIFALTWQDIDFQGHKVTVDESMSISENGYITGTPKSKKGFREIIVDEHIIELLENLKPGSFKSEDRIFKTNPSNYSKRFARIIDTHNAVLNGTVKDTKFHNKDSLKEILHIQDKPLPDITFHNLRHYHATILYKNGFSDQYAAERLGHDVVVLKRIYQHLQEDTKKTEDNKMKNLFSKKAR